MKENFPICHYVTKGDEGFYTSGKSGASKKDPGGETVWGLTTLGEPDSPIWPLVEKFRALPGFPENMRKNPEVLAAMLETYKKKYWDVMGLDGVSSILIQYELFDASVNLGVWAVPVYLQLCLNSFNKNATLWPDLKMDGHAGAVTVAAVQAMCAQKGGEAILYAALNAWQGVYYHVGKDGFKLLIEAIRMLGPDNWRETFEWGWFGNRIRTPDLVLRMLEDARLKLAAGK